MIILDTNVYMPSKMSPMNEAINENEKSYYVNNKNVTSLIQNPRKIIAPIPILIRKWVKKHKSVPIIILMKPTSKIGTH